MHRTELSKIISKTARWLGIGLTTLLAFSAEAAQLNTRTDLNSLLGTNLIIEDFETPTLTSQTRYSDGSFSSATNFAGLGTNLIVDGVTFQRNTDLVAVGASGYRGIDWNPNGYFGATSQRLSGAGGSGGVSTRNDFQFIFTSPVNAFGVDLTAYQGFASSGQASIYDTSNNLLGTVNVTGSVSGSFLGWENSSGIGKVTFHDTPNANYIQFDNLGFGASPVPEPEQWAMFLLGIPLIQLITKRKAAS